MANAVNDVLVVVNPCSTRASDIDREVIDPLQWMGWDYRTLPTESPTYEVNRDQIMEGLRPGDTVLSCGGDGLANTVANAIIAAEVPDVSLMVLPYGNANDASRSLHGNHAERGFLGVLDRGVDHTIGTILVDEAFKEPRHGLGYVGLGVTAKISSIFSNPAYRRERSTSRLPNDAYDIRTMLRYFRNDTPFKYLEGGERQAAHEILFMNMSHMATMNCDVHALNPWMIMTEYTTDHFFATVLRRTVFEALLSGLRGKPTDARTIQATTRTMLQLDGEAKIVDPGAALTFKYAPASLTVKRAK